MMAGEQLGIRLIRISGAQYPGLVSLCEIASDFIPSMVHSCDLAHRPSFDFDEQVKAGIVRA